MNAQQTYETIYRMENAQGKGPFSPSSSMTRKKAAKLWRNVPWIEVGETGLESIDLDHPHHIKDCLKRSDAEAFFSELLGKRDIIAGQWLVGCDSPDELLHWFPKQSLGDFQQFGFKVDEYRVPKDATIAGKWQVMFNPSKAQLVASVPATQFANGGLN